MKHNFPYDKALEYFRSNVDGKGLDHRYLALAIHALEKQIPRKVVEMKKEGMWSSSHPNHVIRHDLGHAVQLEYAKNDKNWSSKLSKI